MTGAANRYGSALFDDHAALLEASGVSVDVARERGYLTVDTKAEMGRRGFGAAQRRVPALLIPLHDVWGDVAGYQARPDVPRMVDGKAVKYETPIGKRMVVDCHPRVRPHLGDPSRPLLITEGVRKADAAVTAGLDCLALLGVWNWRGSNDDGGKLALPDWDAVALNGRQVFVVFDSDVMLKPAVHEAMRRLKAFLEARGAHVAVVYLPHGDGGAKVGLDDFLAAGHTTDELLALASLELRAPEQANDVDLVDTFGDLVDEPGWRVLDDLAGWLTDYVAFPTTNAAIAVTLWAAHTWAIDVAPSTPRLALLSPEPGSGKTRTEELLELVARNARHVSNMTPAVLYRTVEAENPTLLVDEVDAIFGPRADKSHEDLRALVNAGHRRGATVGRMVGDGAAMEAKWFPVFCPVALAGLGSLPDSIRSRSVIIPMRRRAPGEQIRPYRDRVTRPEGEVLRRRLAAWVSRHLDDVKDCDPVMPDGVVDRPADVWEPLLAVADAAGGSWPQWAREACVELVTTATDPASVYVQLLADIRRVFDEVKVDRLASADLAERLAGIEESPWGEWRGKPIDARWLARNLKRYGISPANRRFPDPNPDRDDVVRKGYERGDFLDAWTRYLDDAGDTATSATSVTEQVSPVADGNAVALHPPNGDACSATENLSATPLSRDVTDVAAVALPFGGREVREW